MHSLKFELMSYLPVGNYDIKVLQHRSRKYNLLHLCCQWEWKLYILNDQMGKSYYYMIKLLVSVTQFGQIWKRLNEITLDCRPNFTDVLGYQALGWIWLVKVMLRLHRHCWWDDSDIDVKSSSYGDHQLFVEVFFAAGDEFVLMMKDLCRQKKESIR